MVQDRYGQAGLRRATCKMRKIVDGDPSLAAAHNKKLNISCASKASPKISVAQRHST